MAIQANKPNSRVFLLLGIVLAAAAAVAVLLLVRSNAPANEVSVVVSDASIPAGTTLTPAMVIVTQVPAAAKPGDAYADPVAVVGKTTTVALADNTPLVPAFFSTPALSVTSSGTGSTALSVETQITKGYVAVAIPAASAVPAGFTPGAAANLSSDLVSAGFYILPGDHIDILVDTGTGQGGVRYSFQDVIVLRVGAASATGSASAGAAMLLVEVPRSQAELLAALTSNSGGHEFVLRYVLRPESEWGKLAADGTSYKPNYESSGAPGLPNVADNTVTPSTLDSLFGH
ncbi:MAG TPA: SAF domain-containing protein [Candidatus Acidoferrales bacterium]|nr:SAF domain-containing protein [Candidatus Acidoferrales bacterium]